METYIALIVAILIAVGFFIFGMKAKEVCIKKVEKILKKAYEVATGREKEFIEEFLDGKYGVGTYETSMTLIKRAVDALEDGRVTVQETIDIMNDAYKVARRINKAFTKR